MALISDKQRRAIAQQYARLMRPEGHDLPPADWPEEAWHSALAMDWMHCVRAVGPRISGAKRPANSAERLLLGWYLGAWRRSLGRYIPHAEELKQAGRPALRLRIDQIFQQLDNMTSYINPMLAAPRPGRAAVPAARPMAAGSTSKPATAGPSTQPRVRAVVPGSKLPPLPSGGASKSATAPPSTQPRVRAVVPGSKLPPLPSGGASKPSAPAPGAQARAVLPAARLLAASAGAGRPVPVAPSPTMPRPAPPAPAPAKAPVRPAPQPSRIDAEIAAYLAKANAEIRAIQSGLTQDRIDAGQKTLNTMSAASNAMDAMTTASHARLAAQMDRRSDAEWAWRLAWGRKPLRNRW